jgi:Pathogenicity locus
MTIGKHEMETRTNINDFNKIPNVGPATVRHLNILGINKPFELIGQNPYSMYKELCKVVGENLDPCLADVFISAVKFMEGAPPQKWWHYTEERKKTLSKERS